MFFPISTFVALLGLVSVFMIERRSDYGANRAAGQGQLSYGSLIARRKMRCVLYRLFFVRLLLLFVLVGRADSLLCRSKA
jgi:hypothetical protein